jgi:hypothetical protein
MTIFYCVTALGAFGHLLTTQFFSKIYTNSVRTSQETHYVSATKPNRLMLFREIVAVYCENRTEHRDILCVQNAEFWCVKAGGTYTVVTTGP